MAARLHEAGHTVPERVVLQVVEEVPVGIHRRAVPDLRDPAAADVGVDGRIVQIAQARETVRYRLDTRLLVGVPR